MHTLRTCLLASICAVALLMTWDAPVSGQNGFVWKSFRPVRSPSSVKVLVMGKRLTYHPLVKGEDIYVTVEGPTRLRVLTRIEFGQETGGEKSYYLRYERDDGKKGKFRRVATASHTAVLANDQSIHLGSSRSIYLKVPDGKHTYRFYVGSKSSYRLYLRFYERTIELDTKSDNVAFTPVNFTQSVPLIVKEEEVSYYRVGEADSLTLSVIGPTTIKVLARLEFDPTMFSDQKFRVRVLEDSNEKRVFPLRSKPSEIAEYGVMSEKVPGKGAVFFIEVPRGKHDYRFEILDNGRSALLRFFIPREDLSNNL